MSIDKRAVLTEVAYQVLKIKANLIAQGTNYAIFGGDYNPLTI